MNPNTTRLVPAVRRQWNTATLCDNDVIMSAWKGQQTTGRQTESRSGVRTSWSSTYTECIRDKTTQLLLLLLLHSSCSYWCNMVVCIRKMMAKWWLKEKKHFLYLPDMLPGCFWKHVGLDYSVHKENFDFKWHEHIFHPHWNCISQRRGDWKGMT